MKTNGTKKRTLTNGVVIDRIFSLRQEAETAASIAAMRTRDRYRKREQELLETVDKSRHAAIYAAVTAMEGTLMPKYEPVQGEPLEDEQ